MLRPITNRRPELSFATALSLVVVGIVMAVRLMAQPRRAASRSATPPRPRARRRPRRQSLAFANIGESGASDDATPRREAAVLGVSGQFERLQTRASSGIAKMTTAIDLHDRIETELDCVAYELGAIRRETAGILQPTGLTLVETAGTSPRRRSDNPESIAA